MAALGFLLVPIAEIFVLIQVGQAIGPWWTVLLLVAMSVLGAWLVRREFRNTWTALQSALRSGRLPSSELADAGMVVVGGTLLLTPGFLTDVVGLAMLLPLTRPLFRRMLLALLTRRMQTRATAWAGHQVVRGEVVDDDPAVGR
ncbi:MAG: FxsA family protein [Actinomycetes bacterium]